MIKKSRAIFALTSILMIIFLIQPLAEVAAADATDYQLAIQSPLPSEIKIYNTTTIDVKISATTYTLFKIIAIYYSLDGSSKILLNQANGTDKNGFMDYTGIGTLSNLSDGEHSLRVYAVDSQGGTLTKEITFSINTTHAYPAFILSPSNISYSDNNIPLELAINCLSDKDRLSENYYSDLTIDYKLDNSSTHTLKGNSTLLGLAEGQHKITVTAYTSIGSPNIPTLYSEQTTYFTVDTTRSNQSAVNDTLITTLGIALGAVAIGSIVAVVIFRTKKASKRIVGNGFES
jgi:hypothetical protein